VEVPAVARHVAVGIGPLMCNPLSRFWLAVKVLTAFVWRRTERADLRAVSSLVIERFVRGLGVKIDVPELADPGGCFDSRGSAVPLARLPTTVVLPFTVSVAAERQRKALTAPVNVGEAGIVGRITLGICLVVMAGRRIRPRYFLARRREIVPRPSVWWDSQAPGMSAGVRIISASGVQGCRSRAWRNAHGAAAGNAARIEDDVVFACACAAPALQPRQHMQRERQQCPKKPHRDFRFRIIGCSKVLDSSMSVGVTAACGGDARAGRVGGHTAG